MDSKIEIPFNRTKIVYYLIGALVFVLLGCLLIIKPYLFLSRYHKSESFAMILGIVSVCFFGLCLVAILNKLADSKAGLIIDDYGITDNTNATSVGLIDWEDIIGFRTIEVKSTRIIIIHTNNPDKYINRSKNRISKFAMRSNYKLYNSPISIISSSLKIRFSDLEKLIATEYKKRRNNHTFL